MFPAQNLSPVMYLASPSGTDLMHSLKGMYGIFAYCSLGLVSVVSVNPQPLTCQQKYGPDPV